MKVLIFANSDRGLYHFRKEVVSALLKENEVYLCLPDGDFTDWFRQEGCQFIPMDFDRHGTNPLKEFALMKRYESVIRSVSPDIVFTYTIKPNIYGGMACAKLNVPYAANITGLGTAVENGGLMQKFTVALYRFGLRKAQKVFFQNSENRDFMLRHGVVSGAYDLLPGSGVNLEQYKVLDYPDGDTVNFAFLGRVMKEKGIEQYLEAAEYIRGKYPNTCFHICGSYEQDYKARLDDLQARGIIVYHGSIPDVSVMHRTSACTIHPTYYPEGMSNVLLESCACARPIITTDRSGCREIVEDGVNGFVVKQRDSADLIEKLEKFLALSVEERRAMGLAGRARVEREFDRQIVIDKYLEEVRSCMP